MLHSNAEQLTEQNITTSTLRALIARLCADTSDLHADRQDAAEGRADLMHSILVEIDETILPRQLVLSFGQTVVATLRICHRRLLSLDLADDTGLSDRAVHPDQPSAAQIYAQRLRHLTATYQDTGFWITRQVCETGVETESCSVAQLVDGLETQPKESRLKDFLSVINAEADAWVLQGEDASQHRCHGPAILTRQLTDLAGIDQTIQQKRGQALRMPDKTPSYLVLSMTSETSVIIAWDRAETLLVALPTLHLTTAGAAWYECFSTL
jgi:hypothetical protein